MNIKRLKVKSAGILMCLLSVSSIQHAFIEADGEKLNSIAEASWIAATEDKAPEVGSPGVHYQRGKPQPPCYDRALPVFRKTFVLTKEPVSDAKISICGLGQCELSVNGKKVGNHFLAPAWSNYCKTCYYETIDVTSLLTPGENVLGVMLGNGMYNVNGGRYTKFLGSFGIPKLIMSMTISQEGKSRVITSDGTWRTAEGPITFSDIYGGEDYDATREQPGWDKPGFDASHWETVKIVEGPGGTLSPSISRPVTVVRHLRPTAITKLPNGGYEADLGENLSCRPVMKVKGARGQKVTIRVAELKGKPWQGHCYTYTLKGSDEPETFVPRFTYFGFQYLYVSGVIMEDESNQHEDLPILIDIGADFVSSCGKRIGSFACSNPMFNEINAMIDRSVASNLQHVLTDCPHREKLGWLEVSYLMGPSILFNYDMQGLYRKICRDTSDSQLESGLVPDIAPEYVRFQDGFFHSPEWGSASVQLPWLIYRWYGDKSILQDQYSTMSRYTDYLAGTRNSKGLVKGGLGDWFDWTEEKGHVGPSQLTPNELPATCMFYDNARILWQTAKMHGKHEDARKWKEMMDQARQDFIAVYYDEDRKSVATGNQCSLAMALYFDLVPQEARGELIDRLIENVESNHYRQSTGEIGFRYLVMVLARAGRSDIVYRMINRTDAPGYGCMLKQHGLKTLSERWDKPGQSLNHCMFGHIQEWFQKYLLGIRQVPGSVGYKKVLIDPVFIDDLDWASGSFDSPSGSIEVEWKRTGATVQVNVKAEKADILLPKRRNEVLWNVNGRPVDEHQNFCLFKRICGLQLVPEMPLSCDTGPIPAF